MNQVASIGSKSTFCNDLNNMEIYTPFRKTVFFINNTAKDVVVVQRNNLPMFVRRAVNGVIQNKYFIVRTVYKFNGSENVIDTINMITSYQKIHGDVSEELEIIREMLSRAFDNNSHSNSIDIVIDNNIQASEICKLKACYCPQVDLLLTSKDYSPHIPHPFSPEGRTLQQFKDVGGQIKHSGVVIELVDNEKKYGKRFIKIGKDFLEIDPIEDPSKPSAAYITYIAHKDGSVVMTPHAMTMSDAQEKMGFYPTLEQAMSDDQTEQLSKKQLNIAQTQLEKLKSINGLEIEQAKRETELHKTKAIEREKELEAIRHNHELETLRLKKETAEAEAELKRLKIENEKIKEEINNRSAFFEEMIKENSKLRDDYYDARSANRKDSNELVKLTSVVILTGISIWAAMRKNQS